MPTTNSSPLVSASPPSHLLPPTSATQLSRERFVTPHLHMHVFTMHVLHVFTMHVHACVCHVQLRMCVVQFQSVSEQYSTLYSSLFDADLATLEYVALYPSQLATPCSYVASNIWGARISALNSTLCQITAILFAYGKCHFIYWLVSKTTGEVSAKVISG